MRVNVALEGCRILRPAYLRDHVEVTVAAPARRSFPQRVSDSLGICVKTGPEHGVEADGRRLVFPPESICVRPPGCVWSSEAEVNGFVAVDIAPALLPVPESGVRLPTSMVFLPKQAIADFSSALGLLLVADSALQAEEIVTRLVSAVADSQAPSSDRAPGGHKSAVARACEFLDSRLQERPSLEETARAAEVNKFVLIRQFRRTLNTTPHAYLVRLRLNRARALLARGWEPDLAAGAAGFSDQAHLSRWLKRVYGVTPAGYAREVRSVQPLTRSISFKTPHGDCGMLPD